MTPLLPFSFPGVSTNKHNQFVKDPRVDAAPVRHLRLAPEVVHHVRQPLFVVSGKLNGFLGSGSGPLCWKDNLCEASVEDVRSIGHVGLLKMPILNQSIDFW